MLLAPSESPARSEIDVRHPRPDGSVRWFAITARTYFEGAGPDRIARFVTGTCQDITERRAAEEALRERVTAYYQALIAKDYKGAYAFFTPGYRSTWSATDHYQIHPIIGAYLDAEVLAVDCVSDAACDVTVRTRFRFNDNVAPLGGQELPMDTKHRWLKVEGDWYYLPKT